MAEVPKHSGNFAVLCRVICTLPFTCFPYTCSCSIALKIMHIMYVLYVCVRSFTLTRQFHVSSSTGQVSQKDFRFYLLSLKTFPLRHVTKIYSIRCGPNMLDKYHLKHFFLSICWIRYNYIYNEYKYQCLRSLICYDTFKIKMHTSNSAGQWWPIYFICIIDKFSTNWIFSSSLNCLRNLLHLFALNMFIRFNTACCYLIIL